MRADIHSPTEIYRIVSSKALEAGDSGPGVSSGIPVELSKSGNDDAAKGGKCC